MQAHATPETLQQVGALIRAGKLDDASIMIGRARSAFETDPKLAALGGALEVLRGQFALALPLLELAHKSFPSDLTIRVNLAETRFKMGDRDQALALCDTVSAASDKSLRLARLGAFLAQEAFDLDTAIALYSQVLAADPKDWSSWNNLGNTYAAYGDYPLAAEAFERAIKLAPDSQPIRLNFGNILIEGGDPVKGEMVLQEAAAADPSDYKPLRALYDHYVTTAREEDAYRVITEAARRAPEDATLQTEYGREAGKFNDYSNSDAAYRRALDLDPQFAGAFVGLASNLERTNQEDQLDGLRDEAESNGTEIAVLDYIDALRFRRSGNLTAALTALDRSAESLPAGRNLHLRGLLLDRLEQFDEAFATFTEMNQVNIDHVSKPRDRAKAYFDVVKHTNETLTPEWVASWTPPLPPDWRPTPVFLGSFPRSGTTLLDTMLMADPNVIVLEEQPYVAKMQVESGGFDALAGMDSEALTKARDTYWDRVAKHGTLTPQTLVVDKQPLHTNNIPAIMRLFPDARFILAMRHPCDVLLSCFMTNFRTNIAMANFLDLSDAANLYDLTFSNWLQARRVFDLPVQTVVYERLVEDTSRELRPLFDWLGLDWPGDDVDHRGAARARGVVNTASYAQVTEPIYQRAAGRWHRYAKQLEPVFHQLRPWAERFGYSLEDGRIPPWPVVPAR